MGIKNTVFTSAKWTGLASFAGVLFQLIQTSILARMLTTTDFGIMGLALVVIGFSQLFMDLGFSSVIVQKRDISKEQLSTLFWLNLLTGFLLFLLLFFISPLIASFYGEPELIPVIRIIAAGFLLIPIESMFLSLIQKNLDFKRIAQREIISRSIAFIAGLGAAYLGWGIYSLVVLHMTGIVVSCVFIFKMGAKYFSPSKSFNWQSIRGFFSFGLYVMGDNIINFFNRQIDVLIIGNQLGIQSLGIYNQGKNLTMRPYMVINPIITQISFPILSKYKEEIATMHKLYVSTVTYLSFVNFPIYIFMAVFAEEVVLVLFGSNWLGAIQVIQILSLSILVRSIISPMGGLLMAVGKPKWSFIWNLVLLIITPILLFISIPGGLLGVCLVQLCLMLVLLFPSVKWMIGPVIHIGFFEFIKPLLAPIVYAVIAASCWLLINMLPKDAPFARLVLAAIAFFGIYAALVWIFSKEVSNNLLQAIKTKSIA